MFGTLRMARFVALTVLCLVVATATAQAHTQSAFKLTIKPAVTTFTTAKFVVTTSVATRLTIATGTDRNNLWPTLDRLKFRHVVTVRGLAPNTNYYALITVTPKTGKPAKTWRTFKTAGPGSTPATVTSVNGKLLLNGAPFFASIAVVKECADQQTVDSDVALGVKLLQGQPCVNLNGTRPPPLDGFAQILGKRVWWQTLGTIVPELQALPENLQWPSWNKNGGLVGFFPGFTPCESSSTDMALENWLIKQVEVVGSSARRKRPAVAYVLIADKLTDSLDTCLTPAWLRTYSWATVAVGALGIEYDTAQLAHADTVTNFSVATETQVQVKRQNSQLATLGPCILTGKPIAVKSGPKSPLKFGAWRYGGSTCIIAVNTKNTATRGTFGLDGLGKAKTAQAMWEGRNVKVASGSISDKFAPLAVHIYKVLPAK